MRPPAGAAGVTGAGGAPAASNAKLHAAAQSFESLFWEEVLRAGLPENGFVSDEAGGSLYGGIIESGLADAVARAGGAGLGRLIEQSLIHKK
ncbi:MAG: hypothetical protein ACYDAB_07910 [bacterium]